MDDKEALKEALNIAIFSDTWYNFVNHKDFWKFASLCNKKERARKEERKEYYESKINTLGQRMLKEIKDLKYDK